MTTTRKTKDTGWGLRSISPETATAVWGARAILEGRSFCLVRDRQDVHAATPEHKTALIQMLNSRVLEVCHENVRELRDSYAMKATRTQDFEIYNDDECCVVANTQGSCGYLYITAWLK